MFDSLILALNIQDVTGSDVRRYLLDCNATVYCTDIAQTTRILSSTSEYGDNDCLYVAAKQFHINICIHYQMTKDKLSFQHFVVNNLPTFIHLHLCNNHYTPYLTAKHSTYKEFIAESESDDNTNDPGNNQSQGKAQNHNPTNVSNHNNQSQDKINYHLNDAMTRYLVADARANNGIPRYLPPPGKETPFTSIQSLDYQPFSCKDNLAYTLILDFNFETEVLEALIERRYLDINEMTAATREVGDVIVSRY